MDPFTLIALAISIASTIASFVLRPKSADPAGEADFKAPTAEAGNPIPVFWGVTELSVNTTWWGRLQKSKRKQWFYSITQHLLICWGVVNEIIDISFGDKSCRNHDASPYIAGEVLGPPEALINAGAPSDLLIYGNVKARTPDLSEIPMFGGDEQGGGVGADLDSEHRGALRMYWGFDDPTRQPVDAVLSDVDVYGKDHRWPGFAYLRMGHADGTSFYIAAGGGTPPAMKLVMRRTAWWGDFDTGGLSPLGQTPTEATIRYDANPAEILYDLHVHEGYGIGLSPDVLDLDSFIAAAETLRTEAITAEKSGFGLSVTIASETDASTAIRNILNHIDGTLATDPLTGKLRLKLIRPDYDVEDLLHVNASNSRNVRYAPSTWAETINEAVVKYRRFVNTTEARGFVDDVVKSHDLANWQATGRVRSSVFDLPYVTDPDIAALCATRRQRAGSVPLSRVSFRMHRHAYNLMPGDPFVLEETAFGIADVVYRVQRIDYGSLEDGEIEIEAVEDVFSVTHAAYGAGNSGWSEPDVESTDNSGSEVPADAGDVSWDPGFYA